MTYIFLLKCYSIFCSVPLSLSLSLSLSLYLFLSPLLYPSVRSLSVIRGPEQYQQQTTERATNPFHICIATISQQVTEVHTPSTAPSIEIPSHPYTPTVCHLCLLPGIYTRLIANRCIFSQPRQIVAVLRRSSVGSEVATHTWSAWRSGWMPSVGGDVPGVY